MPGIPFRRVNFNNTDPTTPGAGGATVDYDAMGTGKAKGGPMVVPPQQSMDIPPQPAVSDVVHVNLTIVGGSAPGNYRWRSPQAISFLEVDAGPGTNVGGCTGQGKDATGADVQGQWIKT
jgi:hypothetical protein